MASVVVGGATLVDGTGAGPIRRAVIVGDGERIAQVGGRPPTGSELDLGGLTVVPGLIDAHAHLTLVDLADLSGRRTPVAVTAARILPGGDGAVDSGFTTVRDAGGAGGGVGHPRGPGAGRGP